MRSAWPSISLRLRRIVADNSLCYCVTRPVARMSTPYKSNIWGFLWLIISKKTDREPRLGNASATKWKRHLVHTKRASGLGGIGFAHHCLSANSGNCLIASLRLDAGEQITRFCADLGGMRWSDNFWLNVENLGAHEAQYANETTGKLSKTARVHSRDIWNIECTSSGNQGKIHSMDNLTCLSSRVIPLIAWTYNCGYGTCGLVPAEDLQMPTCP